jgi:hypothetical protein
MQLAVFLSKVRFVSSLFVASIVLIEHFLELGSSSDETFPPGAVGIILIVHWVVTLLLVKTSEAWSVTAALSTSSLLVMGSKAGTDTVVNILRVKIEEDTEVRVVESEGLQLIPSILSKSAATGIELIGGRKSKVMHLVSAEAHGATEVTEVEAICASRKPRRVHQHSPRIDTPTV